MLENFVNSQQKWYSSKTITNGFCILLTNRHNVWPLLLLMAFFPILNIINWFKEHRTHFAAPCVNQFSWIGSVRGDWYPSTFNSQFNLTGTNPRTIGSVLLKHTEYLSSHGIFVIEINLTHVTFSCGDMSQEWSLNRQISYNWRRERGNKAKGVVSVHRNFPSSIKGLLLSNEHSKCNTFRNENSISYLKRNHAKNLRIFL